MRFFSNNKLSKYILSAALPLMALTSAGCADDIFDDPKYGPNADGTYGPYTLTIPIDIEDGTPKTRGTFETSDFELTSVWVGMFDVATGNLIAMTEKEYNFDDGNFTADGNHNNGVGNQFAVEINSILFNDNNNRAYYAGVGNFENIKAKDASGNDMELIEALRNVTNIKEYKNIAVNTASAEQALQGKNRPVMAGFWGTGHGNFTVDLSGKVHTNDATKSVKYTTSIFDEGKKRVNPLIGDTLAMGKIHLRRLYSHINVAVTVDKSKFNRFENPRVRIFNMPEYTFLQEHKTVTNAEVYTNSTWPAATHTAADIYGSRLHTPELSNSNKTFSNTTDAAVWMTGDDEFTVTNNGNSMTIKFGYWHYETKNWGIEGKVNSQNDRERRFDNTEVYSSLCPSPEQDFNNDAPYFVLSADVSDGSYNGRADFYIHEGYCCQADGDASTVENVQSRDFSTFRNVNYTYAIQINGMNSVITKVTAEDLSGDFYHGTGGEIWSTERKEVKVAKNGNSYRIKFPKGKFIWSISEDSGTPYGVAMDNSWSIANRFAGYPTAVNESYTPGGLYGCISLNGKRLGEISEFTDDEVCELTFAPNSIANGTLYLCGVYTSPDQMVDYYTVFAFNQNGLQLSTPELSFPYLVSGKKEVILGIDDHTLGWQEIEGATQYEVTLGKTNLGGGYTVTLKPGETVRDAGNDYDIKLERSSSGFLTYKMRFARSKNALLSLVDENGNLRGTANITVTAVAANGAKSDPATISIGVVNPYWDLNTSAWQNTINTIASGETFPTNGSVTLDGLTLYTGTSTMTWKKYGSYYAIMTGGNGSTTNRGFKFHANAKGKLNVWTSSNGSAQSDNRYIVVAQDNGAGGTAITNGTDMANTTASGTQKKLGDIAVNPVLPSGSDANTWIYPKGSFVIYRIIFTPQDR